MGPEMSTEDGARRPRSSRESSFTYTTALPVPIPVAKRSKVWVCCHSLPGIAGLESHRGHGVSVVLSGKRSLRRAEHSSR